MKNWNTNDYHKNAIPPRAPPTPPTARRACSSHVLNLSTMRTQHHTVVRRIYCTVIQQSKNKNLLSAYTHSTSSGFQMSRQVKSLSKIHFRRHSLRTRNPFSSNVSQQQQVGPTTNGIPIPTSDQLRAHYISNGLPMVGFGLMDQTGVSALSKVQF